MVGPGPGRLVRLYDSITLPGCPPESLYRKAWIWLGPEKTVKGAVKDVSRYSPVGVNLTAYVE
jgi:hypothetical protein